MVPNHVKKPNTISLKRKEVKRILTKRGYAIIKQYYTLKELEQMKKSLHVKPFINEDYGATAEPYPIFLESEKKLYIPKHIGFKDYGEPDKVKLSKGLEIDITFKR